jgi:uncharacterized RDD family membrane protein YckC
LFIPLSIVLLYWMSEIVFRRSLGKAAFGLYICDEEGGVPSLAQLVLRWGLKMSGNLVALAAVITAVYSPGTAMSLITASGLVNFGVALSLLPIFGQGKQTLYDQISRTAVFNAPYAVEAEPETTNAAPQQGPQGPQGPQGGTGRPRPRAVDELIFK